MVLGIHQDYSIFYGEITGVHKEVKMSLLQEDDLVIWETKSIGNDNDSKPYTSIKFHMMSGNSFIFPYDEKMIGKIRFAKKYDVFLECGNNFIDPSKIEMIALS